MVAGACRYSGVGFQDLLGDISDNESRVANVYATGVARQVPAPLAAVDLQGDLVRLLKELLRDAKHRKLVIRRLSL